MGSMLEFGGPDGRDIAFRLYITGDTLYHGGLEAIAARYPDVDLCMIHLGGTRIAGVLLTMDAEQGVRTLKLIQPRAAVPVHYDDYDVFRSPLSDFRALAEASDLQTAIHYLDRGESYVFDVVR
jgi:L-ascorbate metabolism protein UlaG (beta-lactamase superfamily)